MKKYLKLSAKVAITILLMMSLCFVFNGKRSQADAGYHSSYSGGSSSHSSSSHSSSSSYRSSSGSSYRSSSSGSSSGSASVGAVFVWVIIIIIIIIVTSRKGSGVSSTVPKLQSNVAAIAKIKEYVPNFDEQQFLQDGYKIFLDIEDAWMNFNMEKVREVITDEMFNMYESQLSSMEIKGEQNIMNGFDLKTCAITNCVKQNDNLEVTTRYIIDFYDYIIEKESGKVLRGSKARKLRMDYNFTFIMSSSGKKIDKCPNCGAELNINSSGNCEYCGSKIIGENTTWVMSKKICNRQINL